MKSQTRLSARSINQSNRSISVRSSLLFCSRAFISRSYENRSIFSKKHLSVSSLNGVKAKSANSILVTCRYPNLGSASDWSGREGYLLQPIKSTTHIWVVTCHQYGISTLACSDVISRGNQWWRREMSNVWRQNTSRLPSFFLTCTRLLDSTRRYYVALSGTIAPYCSGSQLESCTCRICFEHVNLIAGINRLRRENIYLKERVRPASDAELFMRRT